MKVYLAGGKSDWRKQFAQRQRRRLKWVGVEGFDPFVHSRQGALYEFTNDDLAGVADSDLVLAVVDYPRYTGVALEAGYAHGRGIPVWLVWLLPEVRLDHMLAGVSAHVFFDVETALDFFEERML